MKTEAIALTLLLFYGAFFSGCAAKIEYIKQPCSIEAPQRFYNGKKCEQNLSDFLFAKCVLTRTEALKADYERLLTAFEACK